MALDPALQIALRLALAALFGFAALSKLRAFASFRDALAAYRILPDAIATPAAAGLLAAELGAAGLLLHPVTARAAGLGAAGLLALYGAAIALNLRRGRRDLDCGCAGPGARRPVSEGLVARNALLAALAAAVALPPAARSLVWLDGLTVTAAVACSALLYAAVDTALANAPSLRALRHPG